MNWYMVFKFLHIVAVIALVGGLFARQLVRRYAKKADDIKEFATLNHVAGRIERILVIPGSTATLVFGVILSLIGGLPIFGFLQGASQNWLLVSNILLVVSLLLMPMFVFFPRGKRFEPILQSALAKGEITSELRAAMDDNVVRLAHLIEEVSVIAITALMVFKPF